MEPIKMEFKDLFAHGTEYTIKNYDIKNPKNIVLSYQELKDVYEEVFGEALKEYNSKGYRIKNPILNYYEHIKASKQERLFYKYTIQIGEDANCVIGSKEADVVVKIFKRYEQDFLSRNKNLRVFHSVIYLDRVTPYFIISFVPVAKNQTRGLPIKNSMKQALAQQGIVSKSRTLSESYYWCDQERNCFAELGQEFNLELFFDSKSEKIYKSEEFLKACDEMQRMNEHMEQFDNLVERKKEEINQLENKLNEMQDMVELINTAKDVQVDIADINPQKTFTNAVRGVTIEQIENLKLLAFQNEELRQSEENLLKENNKLQIEKIELQNKSLSIVEEINNVFTENKNILDKKVRDDELLELERDFSKQIIKYMNMLLEYSKEDLPESFDKLRKQVKDANTDLINFYMQEKIEHEERL